jgi:hypothetical protein
MVLQGHKLKRIMHDSKMLIFISLQFLSLNCKFEIDYLGIWSHHDEIKFIKGFVSSNIDRML